MWTFTLKLNLLLICLLGLHGCSSVSVFGGIGSSHFSEEYEESKYLNAINAQVAYDKGATGKGVIVSVIDSGVDGSHAELSGQLNPNGADYVGTPAAVNTDTNGHGTHIAGLIAAKRNGIETHGVAYDATLLSYRIAFDDEDHTVPNAIERAFQSALANKSYIYNNSWSGQKTLDPNEALNAFSLSRLFPYLRQIRININQGGVFVWAAGNDGMANVTLDAGLPFYDASLQPGWLAVAWADGNNRIHRNSNRCGEASAWCITAPGNTYGLWIDDNYAIVGGSSMATGVVSGSLAVLLSHFGSSEFNAQDAAARLLATANKEGIYADAAVYGQGFLNLGAAIQPVGVLSLANGATLKASTEYPFPLSGLQLPAGVNRQALLAALPESVIAVDSFQSVPFRIDSQDLFNFIHKSDTASAISATARIMPLHNQQAAYTLAKSKHWQIYMQPESHASASPSNSLNLRWQPNQKAWYGEAGYAFAPNTQYLKSQVAVGLDIAGINIYNQVQYAPTNLFGLQGDGAFAQPAGNINEFGLDWQLPIRAPMDITLGYTHTRFNPKSVEALWQWQPDNQLTSLRLSSSTPKRKDTPYTFGAWWQQDKYLGDEAATLTLPTQLSDINIGYETVPIQGDWLFNRQSIGLFWQWQRKASQQLSAELVWQQQGNSWDKSLQLQWHSNPLGNP